MSPNLRVPSEHSLPAVLPGFELVFDTVYVIAAAAAA